MSTGEEDRIARSVALEKTYVHDVYDHMSALQFPEHRNTTPWPKVKKFINDLEPGSLVCDVGCGNGKYLKVNPSIFKIGSDRCCKLTQIAKDDDNEVILCDNLTLPFRDESFDAVLSIAVIHHFATKERRVGALRELARVLRIGGRLMITVWAMEQKDRKFESQDVLVQWHHPQFYHSPSIEFSTTATATSEEEFLLPCRISRNHVFDDTDSLCSRSSSLRQDGRPGRSRLHLFQSLRSIRTSPSSSSLSSPNETCYSFVKKALQKLSRSSKKEKHNPRTWFTESWAAYGKDDHLPATRYDPEGCEEDSSIQDLPIELRRMEKGEAHRSDKNSSSQQSLTVSPIPKSRSLNDILSQAQIPSSSSLEASPVTRSRSSLVTIDGQKVKIKAVDPERIEAVVETLKPKLVKQKKSICEERPDPADEEEERDKATDMRKLVKELPMFSISLEKPERSNVLKQKSMTEEIMSADRLKERDNVRQNIQKQASLNEDLIYRRQKALDSLKDTFLVSSSKRFQMFRSGLTNKLKSSTTNIEKVTGASIKSGFVKIFQGLTGGEPNLASEVVQPTSTAYHGLRKSSSEDHGDEYFLDGRRFSHEENSDSSKDNSLQSDTSVDSEDSIISVIERVIPKPETSATILTSPHSPNMAMAGVLSHPSSPKISQIMQYPNTKALSLPASPRTLILSPNLKQTFKIPPVAQLSSNGNGHVALPMNGKVVHNGTTVGGVLPAFLRESNSPCTRSLEDEEPIQLSSMKQVTAARLKSFGDKEMLLLSQKLANLNSEETEPRAADICEGNDDSYKVGQESSASSKDRVRKADHSHSKDSSGKLSTAKKFGQSLSLNHQKSLQLYELFNPETEDIDTDSSGVSTPDSVGSVISVKLDSSNGTPQTEAAGDLPLDEICCTDASESSTSSFSNPPMRSHQVTPKGSVDGSAPSSRQGSQEKRDSQIYRLSQSRSDSNESTERALKKYPSLSKSPENETWDRECRQYIVDLAENLSERLLAEIDRYKERNISIEREISSHSDCGEDPYLTKLSEDLSHVSKLTRELSADLDTNLLISPDLEELETYLGVDDRRKSMTGRNLSDVEENVQEEKEELSPDYPLKDEKKITNLISSDPSTEVESPGSISGWLDSRRNTIESGFRQDRADSIRFSAVPTQQESVQKQSTPHAGSSIDSTDTVDSSGRTANCNEDGSSKRDSIQMEASSGLASEPDLCEVDKGADTSKSIESSGSGPAGLARHSSVRHASQTSLLRPGESVESSDTGDISDRTGSDFSRQNTESRSVITQSSASLASWSDCSKDIRFADRRTARCDGRSSSEETNPRAVLTRQVAATEVPAEVKRTSTDTSLSNSTSQDSLTSESAGGGSIMFHRYYHVFREGELDELIEEFVENLHIISSYYDHTNWCIIAEKVHVWTI